MRAPVALAILTLVALLAPALAQECQLNAGSQDSECYGPALDRGGAIACADDATGQVGICDYQHRCVSCVPQARCTEMFVQGFVGCNDLDSAGLATEATRAGAGLSATGLAISAELFSPATIPAYGAAAAAVVFGGGIALTVRKRKAAGIRRRHIYSLQKEKQELKRAKLDYGKIGLVLIALGAASIAASLSQPQTGLFTGDLSALAVNGRWAVLGLFGLFIIAYAWLCRQDGKKKKY